MLGGFQVRKRMRWTKRFIFGSLVCLSMDGFRDNLVFAVVKDRDETKIVHGIIGLKFENPDAVDYNAQYCMVESPAFFEAYRHVLEALQVGNVHEKKQTSLLERLAKGIGPQWNNEHLIIGFTELSTLTSLHMRATVRSIESRPRYRWVPYRAGLPSGPEPNPNRI